MPATPSDNQRQAEALRQQLVAYLKNPGPINTAAVEAAFRAVPRHVFVPGEDLQKVYSDTYILTKIQNDVPISSSSQPTVTAIMLEMLAVQPGQHVLEIGAGTGYNAALLAHLVGDQGHVVTVDIDEDIVQAAREHLSQAGYPQVQVIQVDGAPGYPDAAPYDRIILAVSSPNISLAWQEQLKPGGLLVMPFKLTALTRTPLTRSWLLADQAVLAFERRAEGLVSVTVRSGGFMPLRGTFALPPSPRLQLVPGDGFFTLVNDQTEISGIPAAFQRPSTDEILPLTVSDLDLPGLRLWLALRDPAYCELYGQEQALSPPGGTPLVRPPGMPLTAIGLYDEPGMCLLTRPPDLPDEVLPARLALRTFGSDRATTERLREYIIAWDRVGRPFRWGRDGLLSDMSVRVYPATLTYEAKENELIVARLDAKLVFRW